MPHFLNHDFDYALILSGISYQMDFNEMIEVRKAAAQLLPYQMQKMQSRILKQMRSCIESFIEKPAKSY
jgi:glucose-1-phosphate adenylyltransferase